MIIETLLLGHDDSRVYWNKYNPHIEVEITKVENYERWSNK